MFSIVLDYKVQHTIESLNKKKEVKKIKESEITEEAIQKLLKITVFMVKKHWAHTYNYEDFVRFIGMGLRDEVLNEYTTYSESHKNATYLSASTVTLFVKVISEWMRGKTIKEVIECEDFTLLLDESTDESNRSELSLIVRTVKNGTVLNHFLELLQLRRGDAMTIFTTVEAFLRKEEIYITRTRFAGMDGCTTMSGEHNGVQKLFSDTTPHFNYIHCRHHRLALCFAHLVPQFQEFSKFDGLLLNLYLLLKHSGVKQAIFEELQNAYDLPTLKLIKAAVTRWLSHGKACARVLLRFESLVAALDAIYLRKKEPAVRGLRDELVKPKMIATLCFLTDVLESTNVLQTFLQGARLNFLQLPSEVNKLVVILQNKIDHPEHPAGCYFGKLPEFFEIASRSAGGRYNNRSFETFSKEDFIAKTLKPFLTALIKEINTAFEIPEHLKGFTILDPSTVPTDTELLGDYGDEGIKLLADFYGKESQQNDNAVPAIINGEALKQQFEVFKSYAFKEKLDWETKQTVALATTNQQLLSETNKKESLKSIVSQRKIIKMGKKIKNLEKEIQVLNKNSKYTFEIMIKNWMNSPYSLCHPEFTRMLNLAALIPPSTAEVERSFSLMKLICTHLRNRLSQENLGNCMRICKYNDTLTDEDYKEIMKLWLSAEDTKTKSRRVVSRLQEQI